MSEENTEPYEWGKTAAVKSFNKFKEGSVIGSDFIMKEGIRILRTV